MSHVQCAPSLSLGPWQILGKTAPYASYSAAFFVWKLVLRFFASGMVPRGRKCPIPMNTGPLQSVIPSEANVYTHQIIFPLLPFTQQLVQGPLLVNDVMTPQMDDGYISLCARFTVQSTINLPHLPLSYHRVVVFCSQAPEY